MSGPLPYASVRYRHRESQWVTMAVVTVGAVIIMGFMAIRGVTIRRPVWIGVIGGSVALTAIAALPAVRSECRVEGDQLWFRIAAGRPISVAIDDPVAIDRIHIPDGVDRFEIVVRGCGRMAVPLLVFDPVAPLRVAVHNVNPGVRFGHHSALYCRSCGANLFPTDDTAGKLRPMIRMFRPVCPGCGTATARIDHFN